MYPRRVVVADVPASVRVAVNDWFTMPFSNGMRNRHASTVNWLALDGLQHGIVAWRLFSSACEHLGAEVASEYAIPCGLPGYEVSFRLPHNGQLDTFHRLVMVPRCMNGERVGVDEPFLLLLHVNMASGKRPHMPISFSNFSPAMPYWGLFHTIASDEPRILRISTKRQNDRRMVLWQLMRQKHLPFQLLDALAL